MAFIVIPNYQWYVLSLRYIVYQFRGFGGTCDLITTVGWLALVNVRYLAICACCFNSC